MKKVLYLTNIEVPYRVLFFNELAKHCDLTVLYESKSSGRRNKDWAKSVQKKHNAKYLEYKKVSRYSLDIRGVLKEIRAGYDWVIVGCYNSPSQMLAILAMRLLRIPYMINLDGEPFLKEAGMKKYFKRFFLKGAKKYLVAGEQAGRSLEIIVDRKKIIPYYFSTLSVQEIAAHRRIAQDSKREKTVLVVAQYLYCKGLDLVLDAARMDLSVPYKLVGMGNRTDEFLKDYENQIPENVEIIPFLQKADLEKEYQKSAMLVLPSRKECWGLVINEAASFATPIVSTWGSGAAVELLAEEYPQYLAQPGDAVSLYSCIRKVWDASDNDAYGMFLLQKNSAYNVENSAKRHAEALSL